MELGGGISASELPGAAVRAAKIARLELPDVASDDKLVSVKIDLPIDKVRTVAEACDLKREVEKAITQLTRGYVEATGLEVQAIELRPVPVQGVTFWRMKVEL